jgi:hypothetical protein
MAASRFTINAQRTEISMKKATLKTGMLGLLLALGALTASTAFAQPDLDNQPKGDNPPAQANWQKMWQHMTPEQRKQAMQAMAEQLLRSSLEQQGINDGETQNLIINAMREQDTIYEPVRAQHLKIAQALMNKDTTDEQMATLMQGLRDASQKARVAREASLKTLDDRVAFSQQPRLEALLTMLGLAGDEIEHVGGVMASLGVAMGNLAVAGQLPPMMMPPGMAPPAAPPAR